MPANHWVAPNPPAAVLENPQSQLDAYLSTLDPSAETSKSRQDELLNLTEFLYGNNALVAALTLLDSASTSVPSIIKLSSPPSATGHTRSAHIVHSSKGVESYLCFTKHNNGLDYCSCRSFLEKATKSSSSQIPLCKHLLALKLAPYLKVDFEETRLSSSREYAKVVLERTLPASGLAPKRTNNSAMGLGA